MGTFWIFVIFIVLSILYGIAFIWYAKGKTDKRYYGYTEEKKYRRGGFEPTIVKSEIFRDKAGKRHSTKDFIRVKIHGDGLSWRGIFDKEEWLFEEIKNKKEIQYKDIVLIKSEKDNCFYVKRVGEFLHIDFPIPVNHFDKNGNTILFGYVTNKEIIGKIKFAI